MAVQNPVTILPRRTGRPTNEAREEATPLGQLVHAVEDHAFTAAIHHVYLRNDLALVPTHDEQADAAVAAIEQLGWLLQSKHLTREDQHLIGRAIVLQARDYWLHDGHEDATVGRVGVHAERAHAEIRAIGGVCEEAVVEHGRGTR